MHDHFDAAIELHGDLREGRRKSDEAERGKITKAKSHRQDRTQRSERPEERAGFHEADRKCERVSLPGEEPSAAEKKRRSERAREREPERVGRGHRSDRRA